MSQTAAHTDNMSNTQNITVGLVFQCIMAWFQSVTCIKTWIHPLDMICFTQRSVWFVSPCVGRSWKWAPLDLSESPAYKTWRSHTRSHPRRVWPSLLHTNIRSNSVTDKSPFYFFFFFKEQLSHFYSFQFIYLVLCFVILFYTIVFILIFLNVYIAY